MCLLARRADRNAQQLAESYGWKFTGSCGFISGIPAERAPYQPPEQSSSASGLPPVTSGRTVPIGLSGAVIGDIKNDANLCSSICAVSITCDVI
jgi:hypothetical protein